MVKRKNQNILAGALSNLAPRSGASEEYCQGLVVGAVAALMSDDVKFPEAWTVIKSLLPANYRPEGIPKGFRD